MADEFSMRGALVLLRAHNGSRLDAAITATTGWTDFSDVCLTKSGPSRSVATGRGSGRQANPIGPVFAGTQSLTYSLTFANTPGETVDAWAFLDAIAADDAKIQVCVQPDRDALLNSAMPPVPEPAPSAANPQMLGGAVISSLDPIGGGGEADAAVITLSLELDADWKEYRS